MKKYLLILIAAVVFAACDTNYKPIEYVQTTDQEAHETSMFVLIENSDYWRIVYHKETKVMYSVQRGTDSYGLMTPLYNRDGSLMTYKN